MRSSGDWTGELHKLLNSVKSLAEAPPIAVDGPYGASSQDVFLYDVSVCIGAGIGIPGCFFIQTYWVIV